MKHPTQPVEVGEDGVTRYRKNAIVRFLLDAGQFDLNILSVIPFPKDDRRQFTQLIGYSVDGYNELYPTEPEEAAP